MTAILEVDDLKVRFGSVQALGGVTFSVAEGELVGLIGPNGAGKTTLIDAITGFVRSTGRVVALGTDVSADPAHRRVHAGVTRTFQSMELFQDLTVRQNLLVSAENVGQVQKDLGTPAERVDAALSTMELDAYADLPPGVLSLGNQKLVAVARALASGARVLLLDEPAAGLDTDGSREFATRLRRVRESGVTILMVDHDMDLVLNSCDRVIVLSFGEILLIGTPEEVRRDRAVQRAYLGDDLDEVS